MLSKYTLATLRAKQRVKRNNPPVGRFTVFTGLQKEQVWDKWKLGKRRQGAKTGEMDDLCNEILNRFAFGKM